MATAKNIVSVLVDKGLISAEHKDIAVKELNRELSRRSRRVVQTLAALATRHQLAVRYAGQKVSA